MNHVQTKTGKRWWWWVALVCAVVVVVSIPASFRWHAMWENSHCKLFIDIMDGGLIVSVNSQDSTRNISPKYGTFTIYASDFPDGSTNEFFSYPRFLRAGNTKGVSLPLYYLLLLLLPILAFPYVKKRHRRKHGLCVKCAYDLTGNESGTCPECGTEIQS